MEFHVSRASRDRYQFDQSLFTFNGNVVFADLQSVRVFAQKMNDLRDTARDPARIVRAGDLNAMGLIDEISHLVVKLYEEDLRKTRRTTGGRGIFGESLDYASQKLGADVVYSTLRKFAEDFPPLAVYRGERAATDYLATQSNDALEELLMLWVENRNPAFKPFDELFDDAALRSDTAYDPLIATLDEFFAKQPKFGPDNQTLTEMLRAPAVAHPDSLYAQLGYIQQRWAPYFGAAFGRFVTRLLIGFDLIKEDEKAARSFGLGPGPAQVPTFEDLKGVGAAEGNIVAVEYEAFTADRDWMPRLVLMAKNAYVWLDQLSRKYQRAITRLDQIPDEELDRLQKWGFTGLWLIGLWQRSEASQRIKQLMGATDAVASAYSLDDYRIAEDLGSDEACSNLKARAWKRGIRLSSDMVPNHMGIDSHWVINHPDRFLSLDYPPYPSYSFDGPDLSRDPRVGIFLENHYYAKTDAAVVFKRVDRWTGDAKYIYHGNDGTSMPWNDTAQINFLNPEAREAVIQTILHVARQFPVIRFDAAMVLAKRHIRRLWFPAPGEGGAIPSRAGHSMSTEEFDALMPNEFWREVVDRAAVEAPDTLLLAEAFWMLEGYFVRTLGMHRVYNSAFMNMLRDEENAKYRSVIKNTIEFDPEVLRRYVNFQNNPDEKTAVEQFGKGDKYFGICTLMCTMPGLPMFGHGQVEGFTEKYGMEFRYPRLWETPDEGLVRGHEWIIFPLLHKRYLFAGVDNFRLYDFFTENGAVDENVFAYSNRHRQEGALVMYHNKFSDTRGWIRTSAAYSVRQGEERVLVQSTLGESLGLHSDGSHFCVLHEHPSGTEYLYRSRDLCERGLYAELGAYQYRVFTGIREVQDEADGRYAALHARLRGRGVLSIEQELNLAKLEPVHNAFRELMNPAALRELEKVNEAADGADKDKEEAALLDNIEAKAAALLSEIRQFTNGTGDEKQIAHEIRSDVEALRQLADTKVRDLAKPYLEAKSLWAALAGWLFTRRLGEVVSKTEAVSETDVVPKTDSADKSKAWIDGWHLNDIMADAFRDYGLEEPDARQTASLVKLMIAYQDLLQSDETEQALLADNDARAFLQVHEYQGVTYFNKEAFELLVSRLRVGSVVDSLGDPKADFEKSIQRMRSSIAKAGQLVKAAEQTGYRVDVVLKANSKESIAE